MLLFTTLYGRSRRRLHGSVWTVRFSGGQGAITTASASTSSCCARRRCVRAAPLFEPNRMPTYPHRHPSTPSLLSCPHRTPPFGSTHAMPLAAAAQGWTTTTTSRPSRATTCWSSSRRWPPPTRATASSSRSPRSGPPWLVAPGCSRVAAARRPRPVAAAQPGADRSRLRRRGGQGDGHRAALELRGCDVDLSTLHWTVCERTVLCTCPVHEMSQMSGEVREERRTGGRAVQSAKIAKF